MAEYLPPIALADEAATTRLGEDLSMALRPGDIVRLEGDLGAGKSTLARALIRAIAEDAELEVPSPTFTLAQGYDLRLPVHHFDLYRLGGAEELDELGLDEAADGGIVLVEWPERAADRLADAALTVRLDHAGPGRTAFISGTETATKRVSRSLAARDFLDTAGWKDARRTPLTGDASARSYETIVAGDAIRVLMDAPETPVGPPLRNGRSYNEIARRARSVTPFVAVARALRDRGFSAPSVEAADLDKGFLLMEHLGAEPFLIDGRPDAGRYADAARLLAAVHSRAWPATLPTGLGPVHELAPYDRDAMMIEVELLLDWYLPFVTGRAPDDAARRQFARAWGKVFDAVADGEASIVLRDFHSPNLIWREASSGPDRIGLLDFQDALTGPAAYDVASLAMDARVDIAPALEEATVAAYIAARRKSAGFDENRFRRDYAAMAAQRNAKILGIFVRLDRNEGKPTYLRHLPRIRGYFLRALGHPVMSPVAEFCRDHDLVEETTA